MEVLVLVLVVGAVGVSFVIRAARERARRDKEERIRSERKRKEDCYGFIRWLVNNMSYVRREAFTRSEIEHLIDEGIEVAELYDRFVGQLLAVPGITLGEHVIAHDVTLPVRLTETFRARHVYIIGRSGSGKTTLIRRMVAQDLEQGRGIGVLAPEAEMIADEILPFIPRSRIEDVVYVNPGEEVTDPRSASLAASVHAGFSLNPLYLEDGEDLDLKVDETTTVLRQLIGRHGSGPRMEEILRQTLYALTPYPGSTLLDFSRFLSRTDDGFRREVLSEVRDEQAEAFFVDTYPSFPKDAHLPVTNRLGKFVRSGPVRQLLCAPGPALSLRSVMDEGLVLLVNLSDGILGTESASVIGQLVVAKFQLAAMSRANVPPVKRRPFTLYLDEFQAFTGSSARAYEVLLSRARKYRLSLVLAHQQTGQLDQSLLKEILGNVSTVISFAVGAADSRKIGNELVGEFDGEMISTPPEKLLGLNPGQAVCRIGKSAFRMNTVLVNQPPNFRIRDAAIDASRRRAAVLATGGKTAGGGKHANKQENEERPRRPPTHIAAAEPVEHKDGSDDAAGKPTTSADAPGSWVDKVEPGQVWGSVDEELDDEPTA